MADVESAAAIMQSKELQKKKRFKCLLFTAAFAIFQTAILLVFALVIMKCKTPKFRLRSVAFDDNFHAVSTPSNSSFNARMKAQLGIKNSNFGPYNYQTSNVRVFYRDSLVGEAVVPHSKAGFQSTKKIEVVVNLLSENVTDDKQLGNELNSGLLRLNVRSKMEGKVRMMFVKKKKTSEMDCNLTIDLVKKEFQDIKCK